MKKYVLDTNVLLNDPNALFKFHDGHIIITNIVLEELDSIKQRKVDASRSARIVIRHLEGIIGTSNYDEIMDSVIIKEYSSLASDIATLSVFNMEKVEGLINDDIIIQCAKQNNATLVTNDINMRLKALSLNVEVQKHDDAIPYNDDDILHSGFHDVEVDGSIFDIMKVKRIDSGVYPIYYVESTIEHLMPEHLCIGDYLFFNDDCFVYHGYDDEEDHYIIEYLKPEMLMKKNAQGVTPLNRLQAISMNALMDNNVPITVLLGSAGTGKTLITVSTALEQIIGTKQYDRIVYTKTQDSQFDEIGFLPGDETDKVMAHCGAAIDALEFIFKDKKLKNISDLFERGQIEFKALNFVRGRSFKDTVLVIDEFQNITPQQCKTILTRAGENCKVVVMGNLAQIDNPRLNPVNSGLTYLIERFKNWDGCRIIKLEDIMRSDLAKFAEENL